MTEYNASFWQKKELTLLKTIHIAQIAILTFNATKELDGTPSISQFKPTTGQPGWPCKTQTETAHNRFSCMRCRQDHRGKPCETFYALNTTKSDISHKFANPNTQKLNKRRKMVNLLHHLNEGNTTNIEPTFLHSVKPHTECSNPNKEFQTGEL